MWYCMLAVLKCNIMCRRCTLVSTSLVPALCVMVYLVRLVYVLCRTNQLSLWPLRPVRTVHPTASEKSSYRKHVRANVFFLPTLLTNHMSIHPYWMCVLVCVCFPCSDNASVWPPSHRKADWSDHREPRVDHHGAVYSGRGTPEAAYITRRSYIRTD